MINYYDFLDKNLKKKFFDVWNKSYVSLFSTSKNAYFLCIIFFFFYIIVTMILIQNYIYVHNFSKNVFIYNLVYICIYVYMLK